MSDKNLIFQTLEWNKFDKIIEGDPDSDSESESETDSDSEDSQIQVKKQQKDKNKFIVKLYGKSIEGRSISLNIKGSPKL